VQPIESSKHRRLGNSDVFSRQPASSTILAADTRPQHEFSALDNDFPRPHYRPGTPDPAAREPMSATTEFKSYVPVAQRSALERLIFFNSCQARVSDCIADAIEKFGAPEIVADRDRLRIYMKGMPDVQSLFALDAAGRPVGVAVYTRQDVEHVTVMHLSIDAEYASGGPRSSEQLLLRLLREVRRSTRRMKGVQRVELFYAASQRWRMPAKAMF
jgi:hypothetical protein